MDDVAVMQVSQAIRYLTHLHSKIITLSLDNKRETTTSAMHVPIETA